MSKIFGEFENSDCLNVCAINLRKNGEFDDLKILAEENNVNADVLEKFINLELPRLVDNAKAAAPQQATEESAKSEEAPTPSNETAKERLAREIKGAKNNHVPTVPIAKRLTALVEADAALGAQILLPHKSLEKCFKYVEEQARKKVGGGRGWIDDEEVYQMAVDYYNLDDAEAERKKEEERKKREEESKKRAEEAKKRNAERAKAAKNKPAGAPATPAPPPKTSAKNAPSADQMTLWG